MGETMIKKLFTLTLATALLLTNGLVGMEGEKNHRKRFLQMTDLGNGNPQLPFLIRDKNGNTAQLSEEDVNFATITLGKALLIRSECYKESLRNHADELYTDFEENQSLSSTEPTEMLFYTNPITEKKEECKFSDMELLTAKCLLEKRLPFKELLTRDFNENCKKENIILLIYFISL